MPRPSASVSSPSSSGGLVSIRPTTTTATKTTTRTTSWSSLLPVLPSNSSCSSLFLVVLFFVLTSLSSRVAGLIPEILTYKTCANSPPAFSECMTNVTADLGDRVVLSCQVDPRCSIWYLQWYHEPEFGGSFGERIKLKDARNANDPYSHTIHQVRHKDYGKYTCVIENFVGVSECSAHVAMKSSAAAANAKTTWTTLLLILTLTLKRHCSTM